MRTLTMKRLLMIAGFLVSFPSSLWAGHFEFDASGLMGGYYGIAQTRKHDNVKNNPYRWVYRADVSVKLNYRLSEEHYLGLHTSNTLVLRDPDTSYPHGDWRFYPYLVDESPWGKFTAGYTYNAAYLLHKGARDITFFKIDDSNMTYFLSNPNWSNGRKSVSYQTPKSTSIMNDGRAVKFSYFTPRLGNTVLGFSYAPDNASRRGTGSRYLDYETPEDGYVAAMQNKWQVKDTEIYTSFGYGIFNRTDKEASFGLTLIRGHWNMGMGYKKAYIDGNKNPITTVSDNPQTPAYFDNFRESQAWNFSIGCQYGTWKSNLAYLHTKADNTRNRDDLWVFSNLYALTEHFELYLVGSYLNAKGLSRAGDDNNRGYAVVTGVGFRF